MDCIMNFNDYFYLRDGELYWKLRDISEFSTARGYNIHRTRYANTKAGSLAQNGYYVVRVCGKLYLNHRVIWSMIKGDIPSGMEIDHIDRNPQNNAISNLRIATSSNNKWNMGIPSHNTSGYKGVSYHKNSGKFTAQIKRYGKMKHLGYFKTAEEASAAYKSAAERLFGEYRAT